MMKTKSCAEALIWLFVLFFFLPLSLNAQQVQESGNSGPQKIYSQEELDRLLAPIALYPDTLISQILMGSTYPLEVIEADRWLKQNPGLAGNSLDAALQSKSWDVSVKSLCHFPKVLDMMSENLDLTNDLGNAFLDQQDQVMNTIQNLRTKAEARGNLKSTKDLNVGSEGGEITIEPTSPDVVYVPAYDPCLVYGPWWYPTCAPPWFWYPELVVGAGFFFWPAVFVGPLDFWCGVHWHRHQIFVDVDKTFAVRRPSMTRMHGGIETWVHNPIHRRGVAYQSPQTARRFGQMERPGIAARRAFRGFSTGNRPGGIGPGLQSRPNLERPMTRSRGTSPSFRQFAAPSRGNVFEGFGSSGRQAIQHSQRGQSSMSGFGRSGGGFSGFHGGGGGFHGGGGGFHGGGGGGRRR